MRDFLFMKRLIDALLTIEEGIFSISQLNCPSLSINRIDIQYIRPNENLDTNFMDFFKESKQTFQTNFNGQPAFIDKLDKSLILGDRDSSSLQSKYLRSRGYSW